MTANETHSNSRKDLEDAEERVLAEADSPDVRLHAMFRTGEEFSDPEADDNWDVDYYLVLYEDEYEDRRYVKLRYFAAHKHDRAKDTFLKNGINIRADDGSPDLTDVPLDVGRAMVAVFNGREEADRDIKDYLTEGDR